MRQGVVGLALILTVASAAPAQTLADNAEGRVRVAGNELLVEAKNDDPAAVRVGAPQSQNSVGKISWDVLLASGSRDEIVMFQGKQTTYGSMPGGVWWGGIKRPNFGPGDDAAMFNWLEVSYDQGVRFYLPIYAPNLSGGGTPWSYLVAGNYELHVQASDGNFVLYETVQGTKCPRWAISWIPHNGTGYVDRSVLAPPCNQ